MLNKKFLYEACRLHKPGETEITKVKNSVKESKTDDTVVLKKQELDVKFILAFCLSATVK